MIALLVFAVVLFIAILISELADRSVLSAAALFLVAGFVVGGGMLNWVNIQPQNPVVQQLAELALFSVLFTDGMRASARDVISAWKLPGRALLFGLPLTLFATALLAHYFAHVSWIAAFLIGAILSPTDPVFAAAIVGREEIPRRLRFLLNVESGINDGLALPIVLALLSVASHEGISFLHLGGELIWGILLGIAIPWAACRLDSSRFFGIAKPYQPLFAFAIGLLVLAVARLTNGNIYLAAFAAGITVFTMRPDLRDEFHHFGELIAELLKLAALLVFGALISREFFFTGLGTGDYIFALLALVFARPVALWIALWGSPLDWRERLTAAWFGPKGFASVIYGLLLLNSATPNSPHLFHLIAIVIGGSILAHSSTDVVIARWFADHDAKMKAESS